MLFGVVSVIYRELDRIATRQFGLVTTEQLRVAGLNTRQLERRVEQGLLTRVRRGVYRLAGVPVSWEQAVLAAVLGCRAEAVVWNETAAAVWELRHSDRYAAGIQIRTDRRVRLRGVQTYTGPLPPGERTITRGIPVTTVERTIFDVAGSMSWPQLGDCVDDALRRQLIRLEPLRRLAERAARGGLRRPSLASLNKVLADRLPGYCPDDSDLERRMNAEWVRLDLPPFERQYRVRCGSKVYRLDLALPDTRIDVEWESLEFHGTRAGMDRDSDRRADLEAEGWHVMVFTGNSSPERIARAVHRAWRDRGGQISAPT